MLRQTFESVVEAAVAACGEVYGERLLALALYGSVARGTMRPDSDIDLLLIAQPLPPDRLGRLAEFEQVDQRVAPALAQISQRLRRDRENAFDGDVDMVPDRVFDRAAAERAVEDAQRVLDATRYVLGDAS